MERSDVSKAAWLGFFTALLWCGALLAYALVRAAFFFLQIQPPFAAGRSASGALSTEGAGGQGTGKDDTVFDGLDAVPWREVKHAYGPAVDAPKWIRLLDSEDSDLRAEAVYGFLLSSAFHQYTLYPATPFVILFAIQALQSQSLCARDVMDNSMRWHLLNFIEVCARCGQRSIFGSPHPKAPTIEDAVLSGADAYVLHANDTEPRTAEVARWLVEWCRARAT